MAGITATINGRQFRLACEDGQEEHLESLVKMLEGRANELHGKFGEVGDTRLTVMAALMIAGCAGSVLRPRQGSLRCGGDGVQLGRRAAGRHHQEAQRHRHERRCRRVSAAPQDRDAEARVRDSFGKQTIMNTIGASVATVRRGEVEIVLPFSDKILQQHGFIHAGAVATIADSACGYAALSVMPADAAVLTTEFKINLLSPAKGERLRAVGRVVRAGKKLVITMGEVFAEDAGQSKQVALITASMMVVETGTGLKD
jgi:uncharacterized protein (TIGR00369 family)